jgi:hypothetical protein
MVVEAVEAVLVRLPLELAYQAPTAVAMVVAAAVVLIQLLQESAGTALKV